MISFKADSHLTGIFGNCAWCNVKYPGNFPVTHLAGILPNAFLNSFSVIWFSFFQLTSI